MLIVGFMTAYCVFSTRFVGKVLSESDYDIEKIDTIMRSSFALRKKENNIEKQTERLLGQGNNESQVNNQKEKHINAHENLEKLKNVAEIAAAGDPFHQTL